MDKKHKICGYSGCDKPYKARGFCEEHYTRLIRYGNPDPLPKRKHIKGDFCFINGCNKEYFALGYCKTHYREQRKREYQPREKKMKPEFCIVDGCNKNAKVLGLCYGHYERQRKYGNVLIGREPYQKRIGTCKVVNCNQKIAAKNLCQNHYYIFSMVPSIDYTKPFKCYICGRTFNEWPTRRTANGGEQLSIDHIIPVSKGGINNESNLAVACISCNIKKHNMTYDELLDWCKLVILNSSPLNNEKI